MTKQEFATLDPTAQEYARQIGIAPWGLGEWLACIAAIVVVMGPIAMIVWGIIGCIEEAAEKKRAARGAGAGGA